MPPCRKRPASDASGHVEPGARKARATGRGLDSNGPHGKTTVFKYLTKAWAKLTTSERDAVFARFASSSYNSIGSMCSGSGMAELVHHVLASAVGSSTVLKFSCEQVPFKQEVLKTVHAAVGCGDACIYQDFASMHTGVGKCAAHNTEACEVDAASVFMIVVGYSCKNLSRLNPTPGSRSEVLERRVGTSGNTAQHLVDYLRVMQPPVAILENVDEMAKSERDSKNVRYLNETLRSLGYVIMTKLLWADHYYLPQKRKRAWSIVLRLESFQLLPGTATTLLASMFEVVERLSVPAMPLPSVLLPNKDPRVTAEEARMKEAARGEVSRDYIAKHQAFAASKGLSWSTMRPPPAMAKSPWFQAIPQREREIILCRYLLEPDALSVDCSQSIARAPVAHGDSFNTIVPGCRQYLLRNIKVGQHQAAAASQRFLLGFEGMRLQGYPLELVRDLEGVSDPQMMDLAGNAFPGTCLMAMFLGVFACIPDVFVCADGGSDVSVDSLVELMQDSGSPSGLDAGLASDQP